MSGQAATQEVWGEARIATLPAPAWPGRESEPASAQPARAVAEEALRRAPDDAAIVAQCERWSRLWGEYARQQTALAAMSMTPADADAHRRANALDFAKLASAKAQRWLGAARAFRRAAPETPKRRRRR